MNTNNFIITKGQEAVHLCLNVLVFQEGDYYVAFCPSLNLSSYGDSIDDAKEAFDDAAEVYFDFCKENGTLKEELVKLSWVIDAAKNAEPPTRVNLDIPGGVLKMQFNENREVGRPGQRQNYAAPFF